MKQNTFLVIIPARAGSKGIENKNIADVCGKPLIEYTIAEALRLEGKHGIKRIIVSSDSLRIAAIAEKLGMEVPFLRPPELATDESKGIEYRLHAIDFFRKQGVEFDAVVVLQPTSPLRTYEDILSAIDTFNANTNDSLISVYREESIHDDKMFRKKGNLAIPIRTSQKKYFRRQDYEDLYIVNGAIFITTVCYLEHAHQTISGTPLFYEMPKSRSINIDTPEDLKMARALIYYKNLVNRK
jgi:CMP-N-acetylneuraminic acid synthetase